MALWMALVSLVLPSPVAPKSRMLRVSFWRGGPWARAGWVGCFVVWATLSWEMVGAVISPWPMVFRIVRRSNKVCSMSEVLFAMFPGGEVIRSEVLVGPLSLLGNDWRISHSLFYLRKVFKLLILVLNFGL